MILMRKHDCFLFYLYQKQYLCIRYLELTTNTINSIHTR